MEFIYYDLLNYIKYCIKNNIKYNVILIMGTYLNVDLKDKNKYMDTIKLLKKITKDYIIIEPMNHKSRKNKSYYNKRIIKE